MPTSPTGPTKSFPARWSFDGKRPCRYAPTDPYWLQVTFKRPWGSLTVIYCHFPQHKGRRAGALITNWRDCAKLSSNNIKMTVSMVVFGSRKRWDCWHSPSPNWQEKYHLYTTYIIVLAFWGVTCYLPPFRGTRNNHWSVGKFPPSMSPVVVWFRFGPFDVRTPGGKFATVGRLVRGGDRWMNATRWIHGIGNGNKKNYCGGWYEEF